MITVSIVAQVILALIIIALTIYLARNEVN